MIVGLNKLMDVLKQATYYPSIGRGSAMLLYMHLENNYIRELDIQAFVSAGVIQNRKLLEGMA